ncbi:hypothetical protein PIB30_083781 [Stylosanthes scabra]|uniref:Uncharacterized protein n=1 Tax=Stylosanthes scabra TaxID=79078 RepID=A0ABU6SSK4_9FABA|nr:hypothetical protein [Stylosanthes scabra]
MFSFFSKPQHTTAVPRTTTEQPPTLTEPPPFRNPDHRILFPPYSLPQSFLLFRPLRSYTPPSSPLSVPAKTLSLLLLLFLPPVWNPSVLSHHRTSVTAIITISGLPFSAFSVQSSATSVTAGVTSCYTDEDWIDIDGACYCILVAVYNHGRMVRKGKALVRQIFRFATL